MSIIKSLQTFLSTYPGMTLQPLQKILTDRVGEQPTGYALAPTGNNTTSVDLAGNRTFTHSYIFWAKEAAANEVDRQDAHDFLEDFSDWLEEQDDAGNYPVLPTSYAVDSLTVSNAMLMDLEDDGTGLYQIQIALIFEKRRV
jgi:hypothetical protein